MFKNNVEIKGNIEGLPLMRHRRIMRNSYTTNWNLSVNSAKYIIGSIQVEIVRCLIEYCIFLFYSIKVHFRLMVI
jgi:hypothetical protein